MPLPLVALGGGGNIVGNILRKGRWYHYHKEGRQFCSIKTILKLSDIFEHNLPRVFLLAGSKICSKILKVTV